MRKILPSIETGGLNVSPSYALFPFSFCKKIQFRPNNLTPYFSDVTRIPVALISLNIIHYAILFSICSTRDKDFNSFFFQRSTINFHEISNFSTPSLFYECIVDNTKRTWKKKKIKKLSAIPSRTYLFTYCSPYIKFLLLLFIRSLK